jgi:hypothetical protein
VPGVLLIGVVKEGRQLLAEILVPLGAVAADHCFLKNGVLKIAWQLIPQFQDGQSQGAGKISAGPYHCHSHLLRLRPVNGVIRDRVPGPAQGNAGTGWRVSTDAFAAEGYLMSDQTHIPAEEIQLVKNTDEARQGVTGHNVRYVLAWGLGAVIVVFAVAGIVFFNMNS